MIEGRHLRAIAHRPSAVGNNQRVLPVDMNRLLPDIEERKHPETVRPNEARLCNPILKGEKRPWKKVDVHLSSGSFGSSLFLKRRASSLGTITRGER